jgi:small-conductance mechanosensitive channel
MFAGAGILAVVIGLASQQAFSNIISGIFMVLSKPFIVGDRIEVGGNLTGIVEDITLRHTVIRNFENRRIVIPNSIIATDTIINSHLTDEKIRRQIDVGIDYQSDVDLAIKLLRTTCENNPKCIDNRTSEEKENNAPVVDVRLIAFQDSSILLRAYAWANNQGESFDMHTEINRTIKKVFDEKGIVFPFPQQTLSFRKKDEADSFQKKISDNG